MSVIPCTALFVILRRIFIIGSVITPYSCLRTNKEDCFTTSNFAFRKGHCFLKKKFVVPYDIIRRLKNVLFLFLFLYAFFV